MLGNWSTLTDTIKYVPDRKVLEVPTQYSTIQLRLMPPGWGYGLCILEIRAYQGSSFKEGIDLKGWSKHSIRFYGN